MRPALHGGRHALASDSEPDRVWVDLANRLSAIGRRHVRFWRLALASNASAGTEVEIEIFSARGLDERGDNRSVGGRARPFSVGEPASIGAAICAYYRRVNVSEI
jgi:hypothetical protein